MGPQLSGEAGAVAAAILLLGCPATRPDAPPPATASPLSGDSCDRSPETDARASLGPATFDGDGDGPESGSSVLALDDQARDLAAHLMEAHGVAVDAEERTWTAGVRGERIEIFPAAPTGPARRHLAFAVAALDDFAAFATRLAVGASAPPRFDPLPRALHFFRTDPSASRFPSAYAADEVIAYNIEGELLQDAESARETLFHEVFHLNDARDDWWSRRALADIYENVLAGCGGEHACLAPLAPHETVVAGGTFYAFEPGAGDVSEYAAELATRYYREQRAAQAGAPLVPPWKCADPRNTEAWQRLADRFFAGVDLTASCAAP